MVIFRKAKTKKEEAGQGKTVPDKDIKVGRSSQSFLIKQFWITEKAGNLSPYRKYVFIVQRRANKSEVKKAVEASYGVKVNDVNIVLRKGKSKRLGRAAGKTPDYKEAIVTLQEGQKIESLTP